MPTNSKTKNEEIEVYVGSGNVYADLGFKNPDLELAKAVLVQQIRRAITARKLTQVRAANLLGLDQPKVSALLRGQTGGYSLDRLFKFLTKLGQRVEIRIRAAKPGADPAESQVVVI